MRQMHVEPGKDIFGDLTFCVQIKAALASQKTSTNHILMNSLEYSIDQ